MDVYYITSKGLSKLIGYRSFSETDAVWGKEAYSTTERSTREEFILGTLEDKGPSSHGEMITWFPSGGDIGRTLGSMFEAGLIDKVER